MASNLKDTNGNIHQFWVENSKKFPKLSKLAFDYLQIPASNASTERQFSKAKKIVTMRRLAMSGRDVKNTPINKIIDFWCINEWCLGVSDNEVNPNKCYATQTMQIIS